MSDKASKIKVQYRDFPRGGEQCSRCTMYLDPGACTAVAGKISPAGWCRLFEPNKEKKAA